MGDRGSESRGGMTVRCLVVDGVEVETVFDSEGLFGCYGLVFIGV